MKKMSILNKLCVWKEIFTCFEENTPIYVPHLWTVQLTDMEEYPNTIDDSISSQIKYPIHHIQYRSSNEIMPYINIHLSKKLNLVNLPSVPKQNMIIAPEFEIQPYKMILNKPQYKMTTVFEIRADLQYDIYHLFAYGRNNTTVYYFNVIISLL